MERVKCDRTCLQWGEKRKPLPRRYPLHKLCCAVSYLLACESRDYRQAGLRVIASQLGEKYASQVREAYAKAEGRGR